MTSNVLWYWKTQDVYDTAKLQLNGGTCYTAAITLTNKTARTIEIEFIFIFYLFLFYKILKFFNFSLCNLSHNM